MIRACIVFGASLTLLGAATPNDQQLKTRPTYTDTAYLLGPEDEISIQVTDMELFSSRTFRVDPAGFIHLPQVGDVKASGAPVSDLKSAITERLRKVLLHPEVTINVVSYHSQPVSILGAVNQPGLHQLQGPSRLIEMISSAGGVRTDAGSKVRIIREIRWGDVPLPGAKLDATGNFSKAEVNMDELTKGVHPEQNIYLRANDVITVDKADLIYVVGEVKKAGGFTLASKEHVTVLQALAMAEGPTPLAGQKSAQILRPNPEKLEKDRIPVDLKKILAGKAPDIAMQPEDMLFVPNNVSRSVAIRTAETALQIGTGLVIWRR